MGSLLELAWDLVWSTWSELGVPGLERRHRHVAIDPEILLVRSLPFLAGESRLHDHVLAWCAAHAQLISPARIRGLLQKVSTPTKLDFAGFASTLKQTTGIVWPLAKPHPPLEKPIHFKEMALDSTRPALVLLRLRALCGVGARADVLGALLARPRTWLTARDLDEIGYTKRSVALTLSSLSAAGFVEDRLAGNARRFKLENPEPLMEVLNARDLCYPNWQAVFSIVDELLDLSRHERSIQVVRSVEANNTRLRLVVPSDLLGLPPPPATRGVPEAWDLMMAWGEAQLAALADGTSPAFQRR